MKNIKKIFIVSLIIFVVAFSAYGTETIKIGIAGAHSGDFASYGLPALKAAEIIVEEKNAGGGILGRQIELIKADDECKPEIATNTAIKFITSGVHAVIGHICSGSTKAVLGIYNGAKLVCISPSATVSELTLSRQYPNFFRTIAHDNLQAELQVNFVINILKAHKIAIIYDKSEYGKGIANIVNEKMEKNGLVDKIVFFEEVTSGVVDYAVIVQKIRHLKADTIIWSGYYADASRILKQIRQKKMKVNFIGPDGLKNEKFIQTAGADAEGIYISGPLDHTKNPVAVKAVEQYVKKYGDKPGNYYLEACSATIVLLNAIQKAGTTDFEAVTKILKSEYVETPVGKISFDNNGDAVGLGLSMYKVENGKFVEQIK